MFIPGTGLASAPACMGVCVCACRAINTCMPLKTSAMPRHGYPTTLAVSWCCVCVQ